MLSATRSASSEVEPTSSSTASVRASGLNQNDTSKARSNGSAGSVQANILSSVESSMVCSGR